MTVDLYSVYKKTTIAILILTFLVIGGTVGYITWTGNASNSGVAQLDQGMIVQENEEKLADVESNLLLFHAADSNSEYIWVPMPDGISASDVAIENHYMDKQLWIAINGGHTSFFADTYITGNLDNIINGELVEIEEQTILKLKMSKVYEYSTIFEDGVLYIDQVRPTELYDQIVIIDPSGEIADEYVAKDSLTPTQVCIDIATKLKALLEDSGIRVYVTSLDEREVADEARIDLMKEIRPDMYVRIETSVSDDPKMYGTETVYNGTYFIPGFGSVELADILEHHVTTSIGGKVEGLKEAGENDYVISQATVPAATVKVGYYTNMQENILLNRDDYRTKIAVGISDAIMEAFEK